VSLRGNTARYSTAFDVGFETVVKRLLSVPVVQCNFPRTEEFVQSRGLSDPEPFASAGAVVAPGDMVTTIVSLSITDELVQSSLARLKLEVANDQRRKAIRYVKGGHMDL
jgi:hypothetical protein